MAKKNKHALVKKVAVFMLAMSTVLSGCSVRTGAQRNSLDDLTEDGVITGQTAGTGIDSTDKNFEELLTSGSYYVVHDGIYYPLASYVETYDDEPGDYVSPFRQKFYTTENEIEIPTLFEGDSLVYYSVDTLLDYLVWERFYDMGYTIGVYNIKEMTSKREYLDLESDEECIIPDSELYAIYDLGSEQVLLDKIGGQQITPDFVTNGIITATQKSRTYDLEVYNGTYYQHYQATANIHAFRAYELFASIEYKTLQDCFYEIEIPEYFVTGYYTVNGVDMFRLVRGTSYSDETDYNEQLLFPEIDENAWDYDPEAYVAPRLYSTFEPLNKFSTNIEGALGYVPEEETEVAKEEVPDSIGSVILKEATIKEVELWFPEGKQCSIKVKSPSGETTGDIYVTIGNSIKLINYNRIDGVYEGTVSGKGERGTLTVSGLWKSYDVELVNCEQYAGQDNVTETEVPAEADIPAEAEPGETEVGETEAVPEDAGALPPGGEE